MAPAASTLASAAIPLAMRAARWRGAGLERLCTAFHELWRSRDCAYPRVEKRVETDCKPPIQAENHRGKDPMRRVSSVIEACVRRVAKRRFAHSSTCQCLGNACGDGGNEARRDDPDNQVRKEHAATYGEQNHEHGEPPRPPPLVPRFVWFHVSGVGLGNEFLMTLPRFRSVPSCSRSLGREMPECAVALEDPDASWNRGRIRA